MKCHYITNGAKLYLGHSVPITYHSTDMANLLPPLCATHLTHTQL